MKVSRVSSIKDCARTKHHSSSFSYLWSKMEHILEKAIKLSVLHSFLKLFRFKG